MSITCTHNSFTIFKWRRRGKSE